MGESDGAGWGLTARARRMAGRHPVLGDVCVTLVVAGMQVLDRLTPAAPSPSPGTLAVSAAQCLPLLICRRRPWWGWWAVYVTTQAAVAASFAGVPTTAWTTLPVLIALYQVAAGGLAGRLRRAVAWSLAAGVAELTVINLAAAPAGAPGVAMTVLENLVVLPGLLTGAWAAGASLRASRMEAAALSQARAAWAHQAVLEERARFARDLHDVAAHHLSSLVTQAEALRVRLGGHGPDDAVTALAETGRQAMDEMRSLLGVLRAGPAAAPTPTLADLPELLRQAERDGQDVSAGLPAELGVLPVSVSVAAYRVIQESLANARWHAPGAAVTLRVWREPGGLRIVVSNPAPRPPERTAGHPEGQPQRRGGHGLAVMGERVRLAGGELRAGPAAGRSWQVSAWLPLARAGELAAADA